MILSLYLLGVMFTFVISVVAVLALLLRESGRYPQYTSDYLFPIMIAMFLAVIWPVSVPVAIIYAIAVWIAARSYKE